jgi:hypothetical protein
MTNPPIINEEYCNYGIPNRVMSAFDALSHFLLEKCGIDQTQRGNNGE